MPSRSRPSSRRVHRAPPSRSRGPIVVQIECMHSIACVVVCAHAQGRGAGASAVRQPAAGSHGGERDEEPSQVARPRDRRRSCSSPPAARGTSSPPRAAAASVAPPAPPAASHRRRAPRRPRARQPRPRRRSPPRTAPRAPTPNAMQMWERSGGNKGMVDMLVCAWNAANPTKPINLSYIPHTEMVAQDRPGHRLRRRARPDGHGPDLRAAVRERRPARRHHRPDQGLAGAARRRARAT